MDAIAMPIATTCLLPPPWRSTRSAISAAHNAAFIGDARAAVEIVEGDGGSYLRDDRMSRGNMLAAGELE
jgi:hypothetical protein